MDRSVYFDTREFPMYDDNDNITKSKEDSRKEITAATFEL